MKTYTILLVMVLISVGSLAEASNNNKDKKGDKKKEEKTSQVNVSYDLKEPLTLDECVSCPVNVKVFDQDFNLIMLGESSPLEGTGDQILDIMIQNSNFIMESNETMIYQLQE